MGEGGDEHKTEVLEMKNLAYTLLRKPIKRAALVLTFVALCAGCRSDSASVGPQNGKGGSMARFAIVDNTLYIVDQESLIHYDIADPANPQQKGRKSLEVGIETIFPYKDNLFVGANDAMYIFDNTDPQNPTLLSTFWHVQSCDPVVVQNQYAYVTLRGGSACRVGNSPSTLEVVDVSDLSNPKRVRTHSLTSPYGLGVSGENLFVCEGENGLKLFRLENPEVPVLHATFPDIPAYDVIIRNPGELIVTGKSGLFQFSYAENTGDLTLLSQIQTQPM